MKSIIKKICFLVLFVVFPNVHSAQLPSNISPQQLAQFKKLPPAQQKSLARSMGVDIRAIQAQINRSANNAKTAKNQTQTQQYYPRGTQFDEFGNAILQEKLDVGQQSTAKAKLIPFGYDVFANAPMNFMTPSNDVVAPDHYVVGPNDTLLIQIYGKENISYDLTVSTEGQIVIPQLGPFAVGGMSLAEAKNYLAHEISNKILGVEVLITLSQLRSLRVFVLGEAFKPGPYILSSLSSITHAIFAAGGINGIGSLRNIQLKRAGKTIATLDLYDFLIKGDSSKDLLLESGDVIFVEPVGDRVTIDGQVKRPAVYEVKADETYATILEFAGGFLPAAFPSSTSVERFTNTNTRIVQTVDLNKKKVLSSKVKGGDVIKVMKTSDVYDESVILIGAVTRPGKYQWTSGQRLSDLIPNAHQYLLADADLSYGLIVREKDSARNIEVLQFDFGHVMNRPNSVENLALMPHDRVIVFSVHSIIPEKLQQLDSMALTRNELSALAKSHAEDSFKDKQFWSKYTAKGRSIANEMDDLSSISPQSLQQVNGADSISNNAFNDVHPFSRLRLLSPIIKRLEQQANTGEGLQLVEVDGAVKFPGVYPVVVNGKLNDLLKASGGLLRSAYLPRAEITRNYLVNNRAHKESLAVNLAEVLDENKSSNFSLQSKDHLTVFRIPAWQDNHTIQLRGEFVFPGTYTIQRGETLANLIERAGGFTEYAAINASVFTREKLRQIERQNVKKLAENLRSEIASKSLAQNNSNQSIDYNQAKLLLADLAKVKPIGRLVIDLPALTSDDNSDLLLENGDKLFVPSKQHSVHVIGEIQLPTSHLHNNELSMDDYIAFSGGTKQQADTDRIYVIKANGSVEIPTRGNWFTASTAQTIEPGDTVVVPLDSDYMNNLALWSTGTQIVYQIAVAIAAISGL